MVGQVGVDGTAAGAGRVSDEVFPSNDDSKDSHNDNSSEEDEDDVVWHHLGLQM